MAYSVYFFTFSKKINSTAQPTLTAGVKFDCRLMDGSGILDPSVIIDSRNLGSGQPQSFNYAYIPEFSRYYFIRDWAYIDGLWSCTMTVDVLASWKTEIGSETMYVLRSASQNDGSIVDTKYPTKAGVSYEAKQNNLNPFASSYTGGYVVVGIINEATTTIGCVSYYVFTNAEFRGFSNYLFHNTTYLGSISDISDDLLKTLFNPFDYIASATWIPVAPPMGSSVNSIPIGWWSISASAHELGATIRSSGTVTVQIPKHPLAATRGEYLNTEPYAQYYLDFPPFGSMSIPANSISGQTTLDFAWFVDCISGWGKLFIGAPTAASPFTISQGMVGVPIQISKMPKDIFSPIMDKYNAMGRTGWDKFDNFTDKLMTTLTGIGTALQTAISPIQTLGSNGDFTAGLYPIKLTGIFSNMTDTNTSEFGRPLCKNVQISTLSGYVQCAHSDVVIPATESELADIGNYLINGFFYE